MDKDEIRAIFLAHGFTIKEGQDDLKPYVYEAAEALLKACHEPFAIPAIDATKRITEMKTAHFVQQGWYVAGHVLCKDFDVCISYRQAVRYLSADDMFEVMHDDDLFTAKRSGEPSQDGKKS